MSKRQLNVRGPILGVDVGGTKLACGLISAQGEVLSYLREPAPWGVDGEHLFAAVLTLAQSASRAGRQAPVAVGIGCGGPMEYPEGVVSPLHIPVWRNFPLRSRLEEALGLPAILDNDAKAFALGESMFGAGRGARYMLGMVVSTGVGGGIVINGRLVDGASGNAGHIGHVVVSRRGPRCDCGGQGCLSAYASGTGLVARAREVRMRWPESALATMPPEAITGRAIAEAAAVGDPLAVRLMHSAGTALGRAIASAANLLNLDRVVLGGGLTQAEDLLFDPLHRELRRRARLAFSRGLEVRQAALGQEAGVVGAAALVLAR